MGAAAIVDVDVKSFIKNWNSLSLNQKATLIKTCSLLPQNVRDVYCRYVYRPIDGCGEVKWYNQAEINAAVDLVPEQFKICLQSFFYYPITADHLGAALEQKYILPEDKTGCNAVFLTTKPLKQMGDYFLALGRQNIERNYHLECGFKAPGEEGVYVAGLFPKIHLDETTFLYVISVKESRDRRRKLALELKAVTGRTIPVLNYFDVVKVLDSVSKLALGIPVEWHDDQKRGHEIMRSLTEGSTTSSETSELDCGLTSKSTSNSLSSTETDSSSSEYAKSGTDSDDESFDGASTVSESSLDSSTSSSSEPFTAPAGLPENPTPVQFKRKWLNSDQATRRDMATYFGEHDRHCILRATQASTVYQAIGPFDPLIWLSQSEINAACTRITGRLRVCLEAFYFHATTLELLESSLRAGRIEPQIGHLYKGILFSTLPLVKGGNNCILAFKRSVEWKSDVAIGCVEWNAAYYYAGLFSDPISLTEETLAYVIAADESLAHIESLGTLVKGWSGRDIPVFSHSVALSVAKCVAELGLGIPLTWPISSVGSFQISEGLMSSAESVPNSPFSTTSFAGSSIPAESLRFSSYASHSSLESSGSVSDFSFQNGENCAVEIV